MKIDLSTKDIFFLSKFYQKIYVPFYMIFFQLLDNFSWVSGTLIVVAVFIVFAVAGMMIMRQSVNTSIFKAHHDVAGYVFTTIGVLYSVLLGFTVINVQQRFDQVKNDTRVEASYITQLYRDSEVFSDKDKKTIQSAIVAYTMSVINEEWKSMSNGQPNMNTINLLDKIWLAYYAVELTNKKQELWYAESIEKLNQLMSARLSRIIGGEESLGNEMWSFLILGGLSIVIFFWFFHVENLNSQILMISMLAASIAFLLFLIYSLDTVFTGGVSVPPDAFNRIVDTYNIEEHHS